MADDVTPLTQEERAELEMLRAQKAEREQVERARRERAELEALRAQRVSANRDAVSSEERMRVQKARERGRALMEPGDDLSMPLGQKIVLAVLALIVAAVIVTTFLLPR